MPYKVAGFGGGYQVDGWGAVSGWHGKGVAGYSTGQWDSNAYILFPLYTISPYGEDTL